MSIISTPTNLDMSQTKQLYADTVISRIQNQGNKLKNCYTVYNGVGALGMHIPLLNKMEMTQIDFSANNIPVGEANWDEVVTVKKPFARKDVVSTLRSQFYAYSQIAAIGVEHGNAAARQKDAVAMLPFSTAAGDAAIFNVTNENIIPSSVGTGTGLNVEKLNRAMNLLLDRGVYNDDICIIYPYLAMNTLVKDDKFINSRYNKLLPLANGLPDNTMYDGGRFIGMGSNGKNALPIQNLASNEHAVFVMSKNCWAVDLANDMMSTVNYDEDNRRTFFTTTFTAEGVALQPKGLIKIAFNINGA